MVWYTYTSRAAASVAGDTKASAGILTNRSSEKRSLDFLEDTPPLKRIKKSPRQGLAQLASHTHTRSHQNILRYIQTNKSLSIKIDSEKSLSQYVKGEWKSIGWIRRFGAKWGLTLWSKTPSLAREPLCIQNEHRRHSVQRTHGGYKRLAVLPTDTHTAFWHITRSTSFSSKKHTKRE